MKNDFDIEDALRNYRHEPGPQVKRSVLSRFVRRNASRAGSGFLRRPVPLYLAAAQIVIALGLGFAVARVLPLSDAGTVSKQNRPVQAETGREPSDSIAADLTWEIAPNDVL